MTYKTLLVAVDRGAESDTRTALACDLLAGFDAHLIGVCSSALMPPPVEESYSFGAMLGEAATLFRDIAEEDIRTALARFHELVGTRADRCEWRGQIGLPADNVVEAARAADLVIVGRRSDRAPYRAADPADVLMRIGRPLLVVPPTPMRGPTGWPAIVAWTDSREAQRASAAALPLLKRASVVHVLECCQAADVDQAQIRVNDVAAWLGRHGVAAKPEVRIRTEASAAADILDNADRHQAGLIVAGGYGHARLREWALGGVTQELLACSPVCLFLSH